MKAAEWYECLVTLVNSARTNQSSHEGRCAALSNGDGCDASAALAVAEVFEEELLLLLLLLRLLEELTILATFSGESKSAGPSLPPAKIASSTAAYLFEIESSSARPSPPVLATSLLFGYLTAHSLFLPAQRLVMGIST